MAAELTSTTRSIARVKKTALRTVIVTLIITNVLVILPGAVFSVILGDYAAILTIIAISLICWAASYWTISFVCAVRASNRDRRLRRD